MLIKEVNKTEKDDFNKAVGSITQSWEWGEFREKTGRSVVRLGEYDRKKLVRGVSVFIHPVPYFSFNIGYVPRCFGLTDEWLLAVSRVGERNNCVFIKLDPDYGEKVESGGKYKLAAGKSIMPKYSFSIDLSRNEGELFKGMKEKTRYNIKLGEKYGIIVKKGETEKEVEIFTQLLRKTEERQGFYSHYSDYYKMLWETLSCDQRYLLIGYFDNTPLSGLMLLKFKDKFYYPYGGSSLKHREKMVNYVTHWEAIKLGKKLGCNSYDMWGAYKESESEGDPWFGIYRFKKGFGGKLFEYPDSLDIILDEKMYKSYLLLDKVRWKWLNLRRKLRI